LAIQENEEEHYRNLVPAIETLLVPHTCSGGTHRAPENGVIFAVGAKNAENEAGLKKFIEEALPLVRCNWPSAQLFVAGGVCEQLDPKQDGVTLLGIVPDLRPWYSKAAVVINCVPVGTGLKIKTVEALCHGCPLVSTPAGIQGLERYEGCFRVAVNSADFAVQVAALLGNPQRAAELGEKAQQFAASYFNPTHVLGGLEARILAMLAARASASGS
jgi:glycosyltransferase involved in cell wall biosynthesis